jgi:hypothetical protein
MLPHGILALFALPSETEQAMRGFRIPSNALILLPQSKGEWGNLNDAKDPDK